MPSSISSKQARPQQARHGSSGSALASGPKQADVVVGDVVMVVIKNQGATKFAKARVLLFKDNANGTRAQVQIVEEDIGDHPIGTKLWRIPEDMRAIPTGDDDCDDDELQEDSSAPKSPPKKKRKKKPDSKSKLNKSASRSNKSASRAKKQVHQRNRPSISDFDDIGDDTNSKFSEEALESRDLENLDEFQEITKQMVSCFGLLVSLLLVNHRRFSLLVVPLQITQGVKSWLMDSTGLPFANPEHKVSSSSKSPCTST
jgi:hypothetical protein